MAERFFRPADDPGLRDAGEKALLIAWLLGMDHAGTDLDLADAAGILDAPAIPYEQALNFFKSRVPVTKAEWNDLEPKLRFRAFTLAKLNAYDAIEKVRGRLIAAFEQDQGLAELWPELKQEGASPFYWETVYRTNFQTAYNAGKRTRIEKDKPDALELVVIDDERTSDICRPLAGLVLPYDHPFWNDHWPPFHFNCRTTVRTIYQAMKADMTRIPEPDQIEARMKQFTPQKGFGGNPLDNGSYWMMTPEMFNRGLQTGAIHELNFMGNVIADYDKVWKGYKRDAAGDGWVDVSDAARKEGEFKENYDIAKLLAEKEGDKIKQLPVHRRNEWKNPDYLINGELWDLKTPESTKGRAAARLVEKGETQARRIVLNVPRGINDQEMYDEIREVFVREKYQNKAPSSVEALIIIKDDHIKHWTADQIRAGWK